MNHCSVLIATSGHDAEDGRLVRHETVLAEAGHEAMVVAAGFSRRRTRFVRAIPWLISLLRTHRPDVVILPDPELFVPGPIVARLLGVRAVVDIHEDYAAVASNRDWIPRWLAPLMRGPVRLWVGIGRRLAHATLVAADHLAVRDDRVVLNLPLAVLPPAEAVRHELVYVGSVTRARGALEMVDLASEAGLPLVLIGPVSDETRAEIEAHAAARSATVTMTGRLGYAESWRRAAGAVAGLSLLQDVDAYRPAIPTKIYEYMASGIPVVATPLPRVASLLEDTGAGWVMASPSDGAAVIGRVLDDPDAWATASRRGRDAIAELLGADPWRGLLGAVDPTAGG